MPFIKPVIVRRDRVWGVQVKSKKNLIINVLPYMAVY